MSGRKEVDPLAGPDGEQIERDLRKVLESIGSVEEVMGDMQTPGFIQRMNRRHAAMGRMLQRVGERYFEKKATTNSRRTCA